MIRKYSKKGLEKRKLERECLPEFFQKHIEIAKTKCCEECGAKLKGNTTEIAHVLPKQYFKSVMCNDLNVLYLCGHLSSGQCHTKMDSCSNEILKTMKVIKKINNIFKQLLPQIVEKINYKHYDRYE